MRASAAIFISYRREEADIWVDRLADELRKHFPHERVFQDIRSIDPGADFRSVLNEGLSTAAAMLVVIGPRWLTVTDKQGRRRLEQPSDLVRQEVAESLSRPSVRTDATPAVALVGTYMFVVVKGTDGYLYLNQGTVNQSFVGWRRMNFQSGSAPSVSAAGKTTVVVARDKQGRVFYNAWELGQGGEWREITSSIPTVSAPAAALVGNYLFVLAKGAQGNLYINQGELNSKNFVGWQPMSAQGLAQALDAVGATSAGVTTAVVGKDSQGRVSYTWWNLSEGSRTWTVLGSDMRTDMMPAASLVGDYLFVIITGRDGHIHINQGKLGQAFVGWQ